MKMFWTGMRRYLYFKGLSQKAHLSSSAASAYGNAKDPTPLLVEGERITDIN